MDVSLAEKLQAFADAVRRLAPNFQEAVDKLVARLKDHQVGKNAPKPGEQMPSFVLPDQNAQLVSLDKILEHGPVAITFHRGHWCPYCRINTHALAEAQGQIAAVGGQVAAIMPDREHFTAEFKAESQAQFPILTDFDNGYALSLNLAFGLVRKCRISCHGRVGMSRAGKGAIPGCYHCLPLSWLAQTPRSRRASSIRTTASGWQSWTWYQL
jgi:peroxiredoxin